MAADFSIASRFKSCRERIGLSHDELARRFGCSSASIWEIETHDDELFTCYSPADIRKFCQVLGIHPRELLDIKTSESPVTANELSRLIHEQCNRRRVTLEQFEDVVGWQLSACLEPAERLLEGMTVDGLQWLCRELAIDWHRVMLAL